MMKRFIFLLILNSCTGLLFGQNQGILSHAEISFTFVSKNVKGTISGFNSSSRIDLNNISNSKFKGSVETTSLDSGNFLRNWSLKSGKYFDTDTYPTISFESTSIIAEDLGFTVAGQLNMKGISKPITIAFREEDGTLVGTTALYSTDFGIDIIKKSREANKVLVEMSFKVN